MSSPVLLKMPGRLNFVPRRNMNKVTSLHLCTVDWLFVVGYCVVAFGIGLYFTRRAGRNISEFFIAGRNLPWWLAGTSIVATTLACDTPLAVSGFVRSGGIYENWFWWSILMGGMLCVFFYARLWRRAGIITDMEFVELRYSGRSASILRGFMSVYCGVLQNCITMGWVMVAMVKICDVMLGWPKLLSIIVLLCVALSYTLLSGFWGVVMTDLLQFIIAMTGSIALAVIVMWKMGGPADMVAQVAAAPGVDLKVFDMVPDLRTASKLAIITFAVQISVQWWPKGQGDGYLVQRLFSTRSERDSVLAMLWFNFAHYVLRPWPWIIVGLASLVYFPIEAGEDPEAAYPMMISAVLPVGLRGIMVASLLAAFMSTMDTQLNWGASYLVNDLYKRFLKKDASDRHYVMISRLAMLLLMALGVLTAWRFKSISGAWKYLVVLTSGAGLVGLLRWYWWRINAWSEISALASSFVIANGIYFARAADHIVALPQPFMDRIEWLYSGRMYPVLLLVVVGGCTVVWVAVTFLTTPVSQDRLKSFYRRVQPGGWWGSIAAQCPEIPRESAMRGWFGWAMGVVCIYSGLFGVGYLCLARTRSGILCLIITAISGWCVVARAARPQERDIRIRRDFEDSRNSSVS